MQGTRNSTDQNCKDPTARELVTWDSKVNEDAIYTPGTSSIRQIRDRSVVHEEKAIDFQDALLKVGPSILLAKIMLNTMDNYFEWWLVYRYHTDFF